MQYPNLTEIRAARERIDPYVLETPVWRWAITNSARPRAMTDRIGYRGISQAGALPAHR